MSSESKVGIFIVLGIVALFVLSTRIQTVSYIGKEGYKLYVDIDNASGLELNSKVKINGVDIGYIENITLASGKARLSLFIFNGNDVANDSTVVIAQESLLGGKFVDIVYGKSNNYLANGEFFKKYKRYASIEETSQEIYDAANEFNKLMQKFNSTLDDETIKEFQLAVKNFRIMAEKIASTADEFKTMGGKISDTADEFKVTGQTINERLPSIMKRIDELSNEFNQVGKTANKKLPKLMDEFTAVAQDLRKLVKENEKDLNTALVSADGFFQSGKSAFDEIDNLVSKVDEAELSVGLRTERLFDDNYNKTYFGVTYRSNPSSYYMFDVISGNKIDKLDDNGKPILPKSHVEGDTLISAQMGKRYDDVLIRAGIIENTGGLGMDYYYLNDRFKTSLDIFDFSAINDIRGDNPHAKLSFRYSPIKHINLYSGVDNFLNSQSNNVFLGAGIEFVDDDLKTLLLSSGITGAVGN